jgi:hypothetical protein
MKSATAIRDGSHDTATHPQVQCDLTLRQRAVMEQRIDFVDKCNWQHSKCGAGSGRREQELWSRERERGFLTPCFPFLAWRSIWKPEVAVFRQRVAVVEEEDVPAAVVEIL